MIDIDPMPQVQYFEAEGDFFLLWCCDCNLRHIFHFEVVKKRGKKFIKMTVIADDVATEFRREYEKNKKKRKAKRRKKE